MAERPYELTWTPDGMVARVRLRGRALRRRCGGIGAAGLCGGGQGDALIIKVPA